MESRRTEAMVKAFQAEKELSVEDITSFKMMREDSNEKVKICKIDFLLRRQLNRYIQCF